MFKADELLKATHGILLRGSPHTVVEGISTDSRTIQPHEAFIAIRGNNFDGHNFINAAIEKRARCIIKEKKIKTESILPVQVACIEVANTQLALGDIARFQRRRFNIPVVAVTGSNGKTTTKDMIAWVLSKKFRVHKNEGTKNNQVGLPQAILGIKPDTQVVVLELGTNHPGEIEYLTGICQPNIGIITNIAPSHLEYLRDLEGIFKEKCKLIENLKSPHLAILNADDDLLRDLILVKARRRVIFSFGINHHSDFCASGVAANKVKLRFLVNYQRKEFSLATLGFHNVYNALAAIAVARIFAMEYNDIALRLSDFEFAPGRLKCITVEGVRFIDDTYNSNPSSLKSALDLLDNFRVRGRKIFVMGDMLELGQQKEFYHRQAGMRAARVSDALITVGELSSLAADAALSAGLPRKFIFKCASSKQARNILLRGFSIDKQDIVLVKGSRLMKMEEIFKVKS